MQERYGDNSFTRFAPTILSRHWRIVVQLLLALCLSALSFPAHGQTTEIWTGKGNGSLWSDSRNWNPRGVPGSNDTAIIDLSGSNFVILDTNLVIGSIDLGGDGTNILELPGVSIQCTGSIVVTNGGILQITSNSVVVGGSVQNSGTIIVPANLGTQTFTLMSYFTNYGVLDAETNSILSLPGTNSFTPQFLPGTAFSGAGTVQFPAGNGIINCLGTMTVNGTVAIQQFVSGSSTWIGFGLYQWLSGSINSVSFGPNLNVEIASPVSKYITGTCTNEGTIRWLAGAGGITNASTGQFFNNGLFQIEGDCQLGMPVNSLQFWNFGSITVAPNLGAVSLTINCSFINYGTIGAGTNSTLDILVNYTGPCGFFSGTTFNGPGLIEFPPGSVPIYSSGPITANGTVAVDSDFGLGAPGPVWSGPGLVSWSGGTLYNPTFTPGFHVEINGTSLKSLSGTCTNEGSVRWLSGAGGFTNSSANGQFYNSGVFEMDDNCTFGPEVNVFQNTGTIDIPAGLGELALLNLSFTNYSTIDVETNSTLDIGSADFESGTHFAGPGTVHFLQGATETCNGSMTVDGTLVNESALKGPAYWTGLGLIKWTYGWFGSFTLGPNFHLEISGPDDHWLYDNCTNQGTITLLGGGQLMQVSAGSANDGLFNNGTILVEGNSAVYSFSPGAFFQNTGTIKMPSNLGELFLTNSYGLFTNYGTIDVESNSTLDLLAYSAVNDFESGTLFSGPGTASIPAASSGTTCNGSMTINGTLDVDTRLSGNALWSGSGLFRWLGGVLFNNTFAPGFQVEINGSDPKYVQNCTNQGTIHWLSGNSLNDPMTSGEFYNSGLIQIETNGTWYSITIDNEPSGTFRQLAGQLSVQSITNCGTVDLRTGTLGVGNFFSGSNSTYQLTLSGATPGTNFNQLTAQNLALNGALQVAFTNGFAPANGSSFTFANDSSQSGTFASLTPSTLQSTLALNVAYSPTTVILDVVPAFFGLTNSVYTNGSFQFSLNGNPAGSYDIQSSSNLTDWTTVGTNSPFTGSVNFTDTNAASPGQRFYRARIYP